MVVIHICPVSISQSESTLSRSLAEVLALKYGSRILGHCNNPALPVCPVCGCGISSCSVLKYWLENEKQEVSNDLTLAVLVIILGCFTLLEGVYPDEGFRKA